MHTLTHSNPLNPLHSHMLESVSIVDNSLDSVDEFIFDEVFLVIDVDALVTACDKTHVERKLEEIVSTLECCHLVTSLPLASDQRNRYTRCLFWVNIFLVEMENIWACILERKTLDGAE